MFHTKTRYLPNQVQYPMGCPMGYFIISHGASHGFEHIRICNLGGKPPQSAIRRHWGVTPPPEPLVTFCRYIEKVHPVHHLAKLGWPNKSLDFLFPGGLRDELNKFHQVQQEYDDIMHKRHNSSDTTRILFQ